MKKFLLIMLSLVLGISMVACDPSPSSTQPTVVPTVAPTEIPTQTPTIVPTTVPTATPGPTLPADLRPTIEPGKETYAGSVDDSIGTTHNFVAEDGQEVTRLDSGVLAVQFFATTTFDGFVKTWYSTSGEIVFRLYRWLGTYEDSVHSDYAQLVVEEAFACSNSPTRIEFTFGDQVDGEYILVVTPGDDASEFDTIGYSLRENATKFQTNTYVDDVYMPGYAVSLIINYTKKPEHLAGPVSAPDSSANPKPTVEPGKEIYAGSVDPSKGTSYNFESSDGTQNDRMDSSTLAVQFFATTTFNTFTKSWYSTSGKILFRLYRWLGTYDDSVYGENAQLVVEQEFDCAPTVTRIVFTFDEQVDGEYILVVTPGDDAGEHTIGYAGKTGATQFHTNVYVDNEYVSDLAISLLLTYTKTPENLYGPISEAK